MYATDKLDKLDKLYNMYSKDKLEKSSPSHQRNLEASKSFGSTITRWNMASMSEERATGS